MSGALGVLILVWVGQYVARWMCWRKAACYNYQDSHSMVVSILRNLCSRTTDTKSADDSGPSLTW